MADQAKRANPIRIFVVIGAMFLWAGLLCIRLVQLQIVYHEQFAQQAVQRQQVARSVLAPRGVIYDSHMDELATSVSVSTVHAEPRRISRSKDLQVAARELASVLDLNAEEL